MKYKYLLISVVFCVLSIIAGATLAEQKGQNGVNGWTYRNGDNVQSYTWSSGNFYFLEVYLKAVAKSQDVKSCYNCSNSGVATVWAGYFTVKVARHRGAVVSGVPNTVFYTSETGYQSTQACWSYGC